jgi:hypothetical protein
MNGLSPLSHDNLDCNDIIIIIMIIIIVILIR